MTIRIHTRTGPEAERHHGHATRRRPRRPGATSGSGSRRGARGAPARRRRARRSRGRRAPSPVRPRRGSAPHTIRTMPSRMISSDSGKAPQGARGRSDADGRPGRGRGVGSSARSRRAASRSARVDSPRLRLRLPIQVANGQPELMTTRHQPISMPMKLQRGRTCQCLQPRSPMSSADTRLPAVTLGFEHHLLDQAAVLLLDPGAVRQRAARVRHVAGELVAELLQLGQREQPRSTATSGHAPAEPARSAARWRRTPAPAGSRDERPGRAGCDEPLARLGQ